MKLQRQRTREVKGKEYFRWTVVIPPEEIESLGWKEGDDLFPKSEGRKLVIEPNTRVHSALRNRK